MRGGYGKMGVKEIEGEMWRWVWGMTIRKIMEVRAAMHFGPQKRYAMSCCFSQWSGKSAIPFEHRNGATQNYACLNQQE